MDELRRMRPLLGTYVEVCARGPQAQAASDAAFARLEAAQAQWSFHAGDSELSRLNRRPGRRVALWPETLRLLSLARALMRRSGGAFDCTVGGTLVRQGLLPDHGGPEPLPRGVAADRVAELDGALHVAGLQLGVHRGDAREQIDGLRVGGDPHRVRRRCHRRRGPNTFPDEDLAAVLVAHGPHSPKSDDRPLGARTWVGPVGVPLHCGF